MTGWARRLRDRPIAERERHGALVAAALALTAVTVLLALTRATSHYPPAAAGDPSPTPRATRSAAQDPPVISPGAERASRVFLAGYLAYVYGHAAAGHVRDATPALARSLRSHRSPVTPAMRARRPRVVSLHATRAPADAVTVSALVNDGGLIDYTLQLRLTPQDGRLIVSELEQR